MQKQTIAIIILSMIIIGGAGVLAYNEITGRAYDQGVQDAVLMINQEMIDSIYQSGFVPYIFPINETASMNIMLVPQLYEQQGGEQ